MRPLGTHRGLAFYTLGQRGGLTIGGQPGRAEEPWYVAAKDAARNALIVVQGHDHPLPHAAPRWRRQIFTGSPHRPPNSSRVPAKVRYRQADEPCRVTVLDDGRVHLEFQPQRAVTPGQYVVLYDGDRCLGGGVIETVARAERRKHCAAPRARL